MNYSYTFDHILSYEEFCEGLQPLLDGDTTYVNFWYPKEDDYKMSMKMCYQSYVERIGGFICEFQNNVLTVRRSHREVIDYYYSNKFQSSGARNRMGCSEDWYDCYYAITQTLHPTEVDNLNDEQLDSLVKVVCAVQEALY